MSYIPMLSKELDFPEIMALRATKPNMVLNNLEDGSDYIGGSEKIRPDVGCNF
ncbi:hypothetical protein [Fontibacter flavus]|uniref:Uncharacterized protein n=1 Tax=Fontibacter flavus TaxID=654838 RepID=A0ABV6FP24_9BACT